MDNPLTALTLDQLRERRSAKWRTYDPDVLPLFVAEMDVPLAEPVRQVLQRAVAIGDTGYAHPAQLAEAYAGFSARHFGWSPDPRAIAPLPDVMRGIVEVLHVVTEPGDRVVVNTPAYPLFFSCLAAAGRRVLQSPLTAAGRVDLDRLDALLSGARAYLICNPHNPTGTVWSRDELTAVAELAERYRVRVLVDEIHAPLTYPPARHVPFLSLDAPAAARAFSFVSASKGWNLPGLKTAMVVAGPEAAADLAAVPAEVPAGTGLFGILAGQAALTEGDAWLSALIAGLAANRHLLGELLAQRLPAVGYHPPQATYLAWLDCRRLGLGDDPATVFLRRGRVALSRGPEFGLPGNGFARLNFATRPDILAEAVARIAAARTGTSGESG